MGLKDIARMSSKNRKQMEKEVLSPASSLLVSAQEIGRGEPESIWETSLCFAESSLVDIPSSKKKVGWELTDANLTHKYIGNENLK